MDPLLSPSPRREGAGRMSRQLTVTDTLTFLRPQKGRTAFICMFSVMQLRCMYCTAGRMETMYSTTGAYLYIMPSRHPSFLRSLLS